MSNSPIISILHPTARVKPGGSFPRGWRGAALQFMETCSNPAAVEYVLIVHESRWAEFWKDLDGSAWRDGCRFPGDSHHFNSEDTYRFGAALVVKNTGRDCVVDQINAGAKAASGQLFIGIMDDLEAPEGWDDKLLKLFPRCCTGCGEQFARGEAALHCRCRVPSPAPVVAGMEFVIDLTGEPTAQHIIYGAMTRKRWEKQGFILHPEFVSMFADNYFSWAAHKDGVVISGRGLGFKHHHYTTGQNEVDEVYANQNAQHLYIQGYATFRKLTEGTRVVACCFPGETFSHRVASAITKLMRYLDRGPRFIAEEYWFHSSNVYRTRIEMSAHVLGGEGIAGCGAKADLVYWQDDDNPVPPEHFEMLLATLDAHPDYGIVTGWCWCDPGDYEDVAPRMSCGRQGEGLECKTFGVEDYCRLQASGKLAITSDDIAPDALWSGFPVVLMRGSVLEQLGWESFLPMLGKQFQRGFTSEDTTFFYRAHQAGIKSAVDLRVKVPHLKLRPIEPQILPASEREKVLEYMKFLEAPLSNAAD